MRKLNVVEAILTLGISLAIAQLSYNIFKYDAPEPGTFVCAELWYISQLRYDLFQDAFTNLSDSYDYNNYDYNDTEPYHAYEDYKACYNDFYNGLVQDFTQNYINNYVTIFFLYNMFVYSVINELLNDDDVKSQSENFWEDDVIKFTFLMQWVIEFAFLLKTYFDIEKKTESDDVDYAGNAIKVETSEVDDYTLNVSKFGVLAIRLICLVIYLALIIKIWTRVGGAKG